MNTPLISIIVPTYNQDGFVQRAVESALSQTYPNIEVIVADDHSTDHTETVIHSIKNEKLKYFKNLENLGRVGNYHNALYHLAKGKYAVLLDGDDYYFDNDFIKRAVETINNKAGEILFYKAGYIKIRTWAKDKIPTSAAEVKHIACTAGEYLKNFSKYGFAHFGMLYNVQRAKETGFYIKNISSSDIDSIFRLALKYPGEKVIISNANVGAWVKHASNTSSNLSFRDFMDSTIKLYFNTSKHPLAKKYKINFIWVLKLSVKPAIAFVLQKIGFRI